MKILYKNKARHDTIHYIVREEAMISINFNEKNKKVLIIGGGKQALVKGEKFSDCTYLSPSFIDEVPEDKRILKVYQPEDILGYYIVIAATNNKDLNHQIICDCNEKNILCASIHNDEDASIYFQKELDFPCLHIGFSTKGTCPGYHKILERDLKALYQQHESILEDLQIIRNHCLEVIPKYNARNDFINQIVEKEPSFLHKLASAIQVNYCKCLVFQDQRTQENVDLLNTFIEKMDDTCFIIFDNELNEYVSIFKSLQIQVDYLSIHLRENKNSNCDINCLEGENVQFISFTDKELSKMMRIAHYPLYIYQPMEHDTLKNKLARSYEVFDFNETLPNVEVDACACVLLKDETLKKIQELYPNLHFDSMCLLEQEFFQDMLLQKIG